MWQLAEEEEERRRRGRRRGSEVWRASRVQTHRQEVSTWLMNDRHEAKREPLQPDQLPNVVADQADIWCVNGTILTTLACPSPLSHAAGCAPSSMATWMITACFNFAPLSRLRLKTSPGGHA
jgi:acyl-CoA synthetase (AMP-forming)/AMP-acid ligase II